ncbi:hypothetical protein FAGKG844_490021 [Frankia sp. AgKG'84/4]
MADAEVIVVGVGPTGLSHRCRPLVAMDFPSAAADQAWPGEALW